MKTLRFAALCGALVSACALDAKADTFTFDLSGLSTDDDFLGSFPTLTHDFGSAGSIVGIDLDINYESFDPSWQSEVIVAVDTPEFFIEFDMFFYGAPDAPGTFAATDSLTFAEGAFTSSTGEVFVTLYEFFSDPGVSPDATFGAGSFVTVTFTPVPEPASAALTGLGLLSVGGLALRRRRRVAAA